MITTHVTPVQALTELVVGDGIQTPGRTIFQSDITNFCGVVGDINPLHLNTQYAAASPLGSIVGPAPLTLAVAISQWGITGWLSRVLGVFVGLKEWRVLAPVFPGDTISSSVTVAALTPTSDGVRHILDLEFRTQAVRASSGAAEEVMRFTATFVVQNPADS